MSLELFSRFLWISEIKQLLKSPVLQQKIHGLKRIEITCKKSFDDMFIERSNLLINEGIIEILCEIALASECCVVLLTLQCFQILSLREPFFTGNHWETVVTTLKKLSHLHKTTETNWAKKILLNIFFVSSKIIYKLEDYVSSILPDLIEILKNVLDVLQIEAVYRISDDIGRLIDRNAEAQLNKDTTELITRIFRCVVEHFMVEGEGTEINFPQVEIMGEKEMTALGEMGIILMQNYVSRRPQSLSTQEHLMCNEFRAVFELVFLPALSNSKVDGNLLKIEILTICLKSADSLFYHPSMEFKIRCSEKIFPVLYDKFPVIESSSSKDCKCLARKLLAKVLTGLFFKDFSTVLTDCPFEYCYSYFKEGLERLHFNISCVPKFVKNNTWGAWSMVIMHYFCIRTYNCEVACSSALLDAISRQVLLISKKGKRLDLVSAKVIWLVFAKHYVTPREGVKYIDEATRQLLELIEENVVEDIFTRHEAILNWTFNVPSSRKLKMKVLDLWLLGSIDEKTDSQVISLMTESKERCQLLLEMTMRSPPSGGKLRSRFQLLEAILSNYDSDFKEAISKQYWDELLSSVSQYLASFSSEDYRTVADFFSAALKLLPRSLDVQLLARAVEMALKIVSNFRSLANEAHVSESHSWYFKLFSLYLQKCAEFGPHELKEALIAFSTSTGLLSLSESSLYSENENVFSVASEFITNLITLRMRCSVQDCARHIVIRSDWILRQICSKQPLPHRVVVMLVAVFEDKLSSFQTLAILHPLTELVLRKFFFRVQVLMHQEVNREEYWKLLNNLVMISRSFRLHYHLMANGSLRGLATMTSVAECAGPAETQFWNRWMLSVPQEYQWRLTETSWVQISKNLQTSLGPALKLRIFAPKKRPSRRVTFSEEVEYM